MFALEHEAGVGAVAEHLLEVECSELLGFGGDDEHLRLNLAYWAGKILADKSHLVRTLVADGTVAALSQPHVGLDVAAEHARNFLHMLIAAV